MAKSDDKRTVIVIEDDAEMRAAIALMLESAGPRVETFACAEDFLRTPWSHDVPKCLVLDVRMQGLSGLGLQQRLLQDGVRVPIIFLTGFGDVASAVQAIRFGGFDFLEKPLHRNLLLERIARALDHDAQLLMVDHELSAVDKRVESLSRREADVFHLLLAGKSSKEIARALRIGMPTVTKHRTKVLQKLQVRNVFELIAIAGHYRKDDKPDPSGSAS
jgi:FixJ family two-component response regulator